MSPHKQAVERQEGALLSSVARPVSGCFRGAERMDCGDTYHVVHDPCLNLVSSLQLFEPVLRARKAEGCRLVHQAELGIDVCLLLFVGESVPVAGCMRSVFRGS